MFKFTLVWKIPSREGRCLCPLRGSCFHSVWDSENFNTSKQLICFNGTSPPSQPSILVVFHMGVSPSTYFSQCTDGNRGTPAVRQDAPHRQPLSAFGRPEPNLGAKQDECETLSGLAPVRHTEQSCASMCVIDCPVLLCTVLPELLFAVERTGLEAFPVQAPP